MKTMLFCTSFATDEGAWTNRQQRWLDYHKPLQLGDMWLFDDDSPYTRETEGVTLVRFSPRLGRQSHLEYPGWWRSFKGAYTAAEDQGYERIIHVESDTFVLSERFRIFLLSQHSGWTCFYSHIYGFPETAIQVICKDQFPAFKKIAETPYDQLKGREAERVLPFTHVIKNFIGDRWFEKGIAIPDDADYVVGMHWTPPCFK